MKCNLERERKTPPNYDSIQSEDFKHISYFELILAQFL